MTPLIRRGTIAQASEPPADPLPVSVIARLGARRRSILFVAVGIAAYLLALLWTMPASVAFRNRPWRAGVAGTMWHGEVGIAGGGVLGWDWAPLRSLTRLGLAVDWHLRGAQTDLGGRALLRSGRTLLDSVSGSADAALLRVLQPDLPFTCDFVFQAEFPRIVLGGDAQMARGTLISEAGSCTPKAGGPATAVPALILTAEHVGAESRLRLAPAAERRRTLMTLTLGEDGRVDVLMTADGARLLPFVGLPAGASVSGTM